MKKIPRRDKKFPEEIIIDYIKWKKILSYIKERSIDIGINY